MKKNLLLILIMCCILTGCSNAGKINLDKTETIIKVGSHNITKWDFDNQCQLERNNKYINSKTCSSKTEKDYITFIVIRQALALQEAKRLGIKAPDTDINETYKIVGGKDKFKQILQQQGITEELFVQKLKNDYIIKQYIKTLKGKDKKELEQLMIKQQKENPIIFVDKSYDPRSN